MQMVFNHIAIGNRDAIEIIAMEKPKRSFANNSLWVFFEHTIKGFRIIDAS